MQPSERDNRTDTLGLSSVHVNRVLRKLREAGMVTFRDGFVTFDNYDRLVEFADFEMTYLDQIGPLLAPVSNPLAMPSNPASLRPQEAILSA